MLSLGERSSVTYDGLAGTTERIVGGHGKLGSGDAWQPIVARPAAVYRANLGDRRTIVKHGEIPKPLLKSMLKQLGVTEEDL